MMMNIQTKIKLNNGVEMPILGLGVYEAKEQTVSAVKCALQAGYRHIDTASYYGNEEDVGRGVRESGIVRSEIFVTTKVWNSDMRAGTQREAFEKSLKRLNLGYIDLYLVHWPVPGKYKETWKVLEQLYEEGLVRAIGVSNFEISHLEDLLEDTKVIPAVNQIEVHPRNTRKELITYCKKTGIACEAWSPLGAGTLLDNDLLTKIGERYHKSSAQVMLRWDVQQGILTIPKSVNPGRIRANADIFDFELTDEEMKAVDSLNRNQFNDVTGADPNHVDF
jgi:diketogulonate reductase-like aldo/keto reductase